MCDVCGTDKRQLSQAFHSVHQMDFIFGGPWVVPSCTVEPGVLQMPRSQLPLKYFQPCSVCTQNPGRDTKQKHLENNQNTNGVSDI